MTKKLRGKPKLKHQKTNAQRRQVRAANTTYAQLDQRLEDLTVRVQQLEARTADAGTAGPEASETG